APRARMPFDDDTEVRVVLDRFGDAVNIFLGVGRERFGAALKANRSHPERSDLPLGLPLRVGKLGKLATEAVAAFRVGLLAAGKSGLVQLFDKVRPDDRAWVIAGQRARLEVPVGDENARGALDGVDEAELRLLTRLRDAEPEGRVFHQ